MNKIRTAIIGAAGYTGGELIRLLIHHPQCELVSIHSNSQKGKKLAEVHPDVIGESDLIFTDQVSVEGIDAFLLELPLGECKSFHEEHRFSPDPVIVGLSTDFCDDSNCFLYGLPETKRREIQQAKRIANPGCFASGSQLALIPAVANGLIQQTVHVTGITGSTDAGKKLSETTHFSQRNQNIYVYTLI